MANVSRSVSLSMNNDGSSKHLYDDVFSAPPPARRGASAFSSRVDDYREIFSPSGASLGSSIPILDLPPLDRSGGFGRAPSSGVDYASVFCGLRDDDGIGVPSEQMFADLKTKAQREARLPRSRVQSRRLPSKSQEFSHGHENDKTSAPAQMKLQYSKSQEFPRNIVNNQTSMSPLDTRIPFLKSDNSTGTSPVDQMPATELPQQPVDNVKRFNVSYHKTGQLSKDGANGMTHIAHLHAVPGYTHVIDEVGPVKKAAFDKAKTMSMGDADFSLKVGEVSRQGKHTRAASDLCANEREANCKSQNFSTSVSNSPQSFGSDYFKRSSSQRSKRSVSNREFRTKAGSSIPLLDEELDVNSAAALSAAAMKRAIEEAEEKILWAKAFLKQLEGNGFIKPTLKDSFRVKAAAAMKHSSEIHGPKENVNLKVKSTKKKCIDEEKVLKSNGCLKNRPLGETNHTNGAVGRRPKDALDDKATSESQLENEVDVLKHRCYGDAAQVDTNMEKSVSFNSPASETLKTPESLHQRDYFNYKTKAHGDLKLPEKVYKSEGGEWEAAKHLSQLISGVKSRLVSFISKQADSERTVQEAPSKCESLEPSEETVYEVQNTDTKNDGGADHENHEKLVKMSRCTSTVPGVSVEDSNRTTIGVEACEAEQKEAKMYNAASPDTETCANQQCGRHESKEGLDRIEAEVLADDVDYLKQEDMTSEVKDECLQEVREQSQESLSSTVRAEYGKSEMANIGLRGHADMPETTCQSRQFDGIGASGENDDATVEDVRNLETAGKGIGDDSLSGGRVNCRQLVGDSWEETKMSNCAEKKQPEDIRIVEETSMMDEDCQGVIEAEEEHDGEDAEKIASQNAMSEATEGLIDVVDEDSEHGEYGAEALDLGKQDQLLGETTKTSTLAERDELVKKERMAESSATVAVEPKENVEQHMSVQESKQLIREGTLEQTLHSVEVDEGSKQGECFLAADSMHVQDDLSFSCRDKPHDCRKPCALDEDLSSEKESLSDPAFSIETPSSMWMGDESCEKSRSAVETADDILGSSHYLATDDVGHDVSMKSELSGKNAESNNNRCSEPEWKFSFEAKIMTTVGNTSEPRGNDEQPGSVKTTVEQMLEASVSAGDEVDSAKYEMEIAGAHETHPSTNTQITESETVLDVEQEPPDEAENVATVVTPDNEDNEAEFSTSESNANNKAAEQDTKSHDSESPYKRKRWFKSGAEMGEFRLKDQQNSEVDTQVDEMIGESGVGVHVAQADAVSSQDQESGQSNEVTHRRRRWFESGGEVLHKPIPFDGIASTEDINNEVKETKEMDNVVNDQAESRARTEAAHRRRRWFENGEKSTAAQRPNILEDNEATTQPKESKETVIDTARHDEQLREKSSTEDLASMRQNEGQSVQREKERERAAVERAIREARQRAFVEARERAAVEARLKASAAAQERQGKTAVSDKASMDAKIRAERAAVERATAEARERAMNKAMSDNAGYKNQSSGFSNSAVNESPQREKAISERNKRTTERAAKALQEKNMRDYLAQKEQAERNRYADVLDAEVKRWSTGKEGNLRSLLSTLQYILGPESGWQPTSLTDLVTTTAVRKAYKRAALCVHPDKLQQRRATVQQKYVCEKVFDLLKDAWHRFNPDDR